MRRLISQPAVEGIYVSVIVPCYRSKASVLDVLRRIPSEIHRIYVVDDGCPEGTGKYVQQASQDPRVTVLFNDGNKGVGGAVITGYEAALQERCDVLVKVDSDGQMAPEMIPKLIRPIVVGWADYAKGNRFYQANFLMGMPFSRLLGNALLSFVSKMTSGYWNVMDPTNGFTAIHRKVLQQIPLSKIHRGYFFESDMLFRLNLIDAVVVDVPMASHYDTGVPSYLSIRRVIPVFFRFHLQNLFKRIIYKYMVRDFNLGSLALLIGLSFLLFGSIFGGYHWVASLDSPLGAPLGTITIAALSISLGTLFTLFFFFADITQIPRTSLREVLD